jgi:hypothetical protein
MFPPRMRVDRRQYQDQADQVFHAAVRKLCGHSLLAFASTSSPPDLASSASVASPNVPIMLPSTMRRRATYLRRGRSNMAKLTAQSKPTCYPPEAIAPGSRQPNSLAPG